ncbi:MAG: PIN domain-containing protein [Chthoniobacterales bacterium]
MESANTNLQKTEANKQREGGTQESKPEGEAQARHLIAIFKSWPIEFRYPDEQLCLAAGEIKASFPLPFADAFVAATAQTAKALLFHKDREFKSLKGTIRLKSLPYKAVRSC